MSFISYCLTKKSQSIFARVIVEREKPCILCTDEKGRSESEWVHDYSKRCEVKGRQQEQPVCGGQQQLKVLAWCG